MPIELPNPFLLPGCPMLQNPSDWEAHRRRLTEAVIPLAYGGLPPGPPATHLEILHLAARDWDNGPFHFSARVRVEFDPPVFWALEIRSPGGPGPFPTIINGDGCWDYATGEVVAEVLRRGYLWVRFNRTEIVPDYSHGRRVGGLWDRFPGTTFGSIAAWAWGYHRTIDALAEMAACDRQRMAVVGHSRGGKTTLLAGATDPRIALTGVNNSGCGGAGSYLYLAPGAETLERMMKIFPEWLGPEMAAYEGRIGQLPFDQHFLKALVAPRALLTTEALADVGANPEGTWQTHRAAREVYRWLGVEDRLGIVYRPGGHAHSLEDWRTFLDFADWRLRNRPPNRSFAANPYPELPPAHRWEAPSAEHCLSSNSR